MSQSHDKQSLSALTLAALGVVFGDIGTSPLYAMKEAFAQTHYPLPVIADNVLGILSLMVWSLLIIVTFKYVMIVLRADNHGEGGVVALMARVVERAKDRPRKRTFAIWAGLFGASLFYGDGVITPAISVLSAVEGLEVATPAFTPFVLPITVGILIGLFCMQSKGTAKVGAFFGPIVCVWFGALALVGISNIVAHPQVLAALSPHYALSFLATHQTVGFLAMGAVFLTVTGGEALYADMGHFGKKPIRLAWVGLVLPALLLNYFGQGALLIADPEAARNPFYLSVPEWGLYPMVGLATAATVIASQALITGAFSVTRELIQLGYCPRMNIRHTSGSQMGQIYMPFVNWTLLILVILVVLGFKSSSALAAAYGIAVTLTMLVTTILAFSVARRDWHWHNLLALAVFGPLLVIELVFLAANATKIADGGWFPLVFGGIIFLLLTTWRSGREQLSLRMATDSVPLVPFVQSLQHETVLRADHTAVFLNPRPEQVPNALLHNLKHNRVVHDKMIFLTVSFLPVPRVEMSQRVLVERICHNAHRVKVFFGFMETPDIPAALEWAEEQGLEVDAASVSWFISRETLLPTPGEGMPVWRERIFELMFRNATPATRFFQLPPGRVVELGSQIAI
ncbi:potassium transporter Kup [Viridibacterium curvum]|uniref:Probable potassium transport system protein Kup n=1 Tax=Viridibacterium curvum TaxID=1101404 RepID=A0ABP9QQC3_9RHOO